MAIIFLISLFFGLDIEKANALSLAPALVEVEAEPGETLVQKLRLFNEANQTVAIYPSLENFQPQEDRPQPKFLGDTDPFGAARWIEVPVKKVVLKAGEAKDILLKIKVSALAEPGGHYAALFWSDQPGKNVGIGSASRVASLFLFKIKGNIKEQAIIVSFDKKSTDWPLEFFVRMENNGNVHLSPRGTLEIFNWRGKKIKELAVNPMGQSILPHSQRQFNLVWPEERPLSGLYAARVKLFYGANNKELSSKITFWMLPSAWGFKLIGLIIIILLIWLGVKMSRRKVRFIGILIFLFLLLTADSVFAASSSTSGTATVSGTYTQSSGCTGCGGGGGESGSGGDTTAPAAVANLLVDAVTDTAATLKWTAPGDDNNSGTASQYDIRYSLERITEENWAAAASINNEPAPQLVGAAQSVIVSNLIPSTQYYFALKTADEKPNWSLLSNVASAFTLPASQLPEPGADITSPEIFEIRVKPGINSAIIYWFTNEPADSQVAYGLTNQLGLLKTSASLVENHAIFLSNLSPDTVYYFKIISADESGNQAVGLYDGEEIGTFKTLPAETIPPAPPAGGQPPSGGSVPQCSDDADNDGDSYVDYPNDLGCIDPQDNDETEEVGGGLPASPGGEPAAGEASGGAAIDELQLSDFIFSVAKGKIIIPANFNIQTLVGSGLQAFLPQSKAPKTIESLILNIAGDSYLFSLQNGQWQTEISAPVLPGIYQAVFLVNFSDQTKNIVSWQLTAKSYGQIYEKVNGQKNPLAGAVISLFKNNALWPANNFYQSNPQITIEDGLFGFLAPPGNYLLQIEKEDYSSEKFSLASDGVIINPDVELLAVPPLLKEVIDLNAPLMQNAQNIAKNLGEKAQFIGKKISKEVGQSTQKIVGEVAKIIQDPEAQKTAEQVAAPVITGAAAAVATASMGWASFLNYLRFLFTQPALLFKRRKRKNWGVVYNSLTKLPLGLMTVRLIDAETGRVIQSRVTDGEGRYAFFPAVGSYKLEIFSDQFDFPSRFFSVLREDDQFVDLYHGEIIEVKEKGATITANIPLDPVGAKRPVRHLIWQLTWRRLQNVLSVVSILVAIGFAVWVPGIITIGLLAVQLAFYALFRRLAIPPKPKNWGIIYDEHTRLPLTQAIARIFDRQYNKLLETQVTDKSGRYAFLVGRNEYYVTYEKNGYEKKQSALIDLKNSPEPVASVGLDTGLKPAEYDIIIDKNEEGEISHYHD